MHQIDHNEIRNSLSAVVEVVGYELRELDVRREEMTRRIRNLYSAIAALKKCSHLSEEQSVGKSLRMVEPPLVRKRVAARIHRSKQEWDKQNSSLRRACRIALLETEEAVPAKEIQARIARRGSFTFTQPNSAVPSLLTELKRMAEDGEVGFSRAGHDYLWQRAPWTDESQEEESVGPQELLNTLPHTTRQQRTCLRQTARKDF
jgi:hypothetical protein